MSVCGACMAITGVLKVVYSLFMRKLHIYTIWKCLDKPYVQRWRNLLLYKNQKKTKIMTKQLRNVIKLYKMQMR